MVLIFAGTLASASQPCGKETSPRNFNAPLILAPSHNRHPDSSMTSSICTPSGVFECQDLGGMLRKVSANELHYAKISEGWRHAGPSCESRARRWSKHQCLMLQTCQVNMTMILVNGRIIPNPTFNTISRHDRRNICENGQI